VGSSSNISTRLKQYFNINYLLKNTRMLICKALLKNGYSKFELKILEYCYKTDVIKREQHYIDLLNPEYNILKIAGSTLGFRHSKETLAKMSVAKIGTKHSEETLAKIGRHSRGLPRAYVGGSPAQKIEVLNFLTGEKKYYDSMLAAALDLGISRTVI